MKLCFLKCEILKCLGVEDSGNTNADFEGTIVKYTNKIFSEFAERNKNNKNVILYANANGIQSLSDESLADCVYFLNLLSFVVQGSNTSNNCVNYAFVNRNESVKNALYLVSVIRKLGKNLFASAEQICKCEYDTIVSVMYCIISIAHK